MPAQLVQGQEPWNGTYITGSIALTPGLTFIEMSTSMSDVDASDTTKTATFRIEVTYDGENWVNPPSYILNWVGGINRLGNPAVPGLGPSVNKDDQGRDPLRARVNWDTQGNWLNTGILLNNR